MKKQPRRRIFRDERFKPKPVIHEPYPDTRKRPDPTQHKKLLPIKRPRPHPRANAMTVCIGALSGDDKYVTVSDMMLTNTGGAQLQVDIGAAKSLPFGDKCLMCFSGSESWAAAVDAHAFALIGDEPKTTTRVRDALQSAYQSVRKEYAERVLAQYGVTLDEFAKNGLAWFGEATFMDLWHVIDEGWSLDLLAGGFSEGQQSGFVLTVGEYGIGTLYLGCPMAAIGSGSDAAQTILFKTYRRDMPAYDLAARMLEAKFAAESTPYVGGMSLVRTVDSTGKQEMFADILTVKNIWEKHGKNYVEEAAKAIEGLFVPVPASGAKTSAR